MKILLRTLLAILCCGPLWLVATAMAQTSPADIQKLAEGVDKHYNNLTSMQADFAEIYRGGGMARSESGVMWLKKPGKMRWEYRNPREKLFITDGKTAWFYVPGERQARRASVKRLDDMRSPLRYLLGRTKLMKEFEGLSLAPDARPANQGNVMLRGVPKGMQDRVSQVLLEITPERRIARIFLEELDGSTTEFRFLQQRENVQVADERFRFSPPRGIEVMEASELAPQ
ncbi:MAG TPA: outer membrane lipoprotein chaperone LolA [Clostridia bacterium]|nr:outer membrane lipoprotein chaperone LolA [Clostridia bacterium]